MILQKFEYSESNEGKKSWSLNNLTLGKINLLVGKNATGKTKILDAISGLSQMLVGKNIHKTIQADYRAQFSETEIIYQYKLGIKSGVVSDEKLNINEAMKFQRDYQGRGKIYMDTTKDFIDIQAPTQKLLAETRRDGIQHPYIQNIYDWAQGIRFYEFGKQLGKNIGFETTQSIDKIAINPMRTNSLVPLFLVGNSSFPLDFKKSIISYMNNLDYKIDDIGVDYDKSLRIRATDSVPRQLFVCEKEVYGYIFQRQMSQGMYRALSLLTQIIFNVLNKYHITILIDDIGEGLDFDRSTKLIQLLIEIASKNDIQLIMSTNDRYVMNNVPFKYWQVIQRNGGECMIYNYQNSKDKFDDFKFTGLNNFDFLRTDWLNQKWEEE